MSSQEELSPKSDSNKASGFPSVAERVKKAWGMDEPSQLARRVGVKSKRLKISGGHPFAHVTNLDRRFMLKVLEIVGNPPVSVALWDGKVINPGVAEAVGSLYFHDRIAVLKLLANPELHFGDLYSSGRVSFEGDMVRFLEAVYLGIKQGNKTGVLRRVIEWLGHRRIANSLSTARDNICHHYDIGNDFYQMWLDNEVMQYTCAYFPDPQMTLEQAQVAKLHHVCRKLQLKPGDTVVEAGCGWGGLARFMAKYYGVKVKAFNISHEQVVFAREQAEKQGLSAQVEYIEDDYRNIQGEFDVFVSVGMLEHVGTRDYIVLGNVIDGCLKANGRGLIHTIGRNQAGPMNAWIERRIFPGAYPPTLREMMDIFEPNDYAIQDVENLRLHYAKTLEHWLARFESHADEITGMLDDEFVRAWRLYLAGSIAAFTTSELQLYQVAFTRAQHNQLPWSRAALYQQDL